MAWSARTCALGNASRQHRLPVAPARATAARSVKIDSDHFDNNYDPVELERLNDDPKGASDDIIAFMSNLKAIIFDMKAVIFG